MEPRENRVSKEIQELMGQKVNMEIKDNQEMADRKVNQD